MSLPSHKVVFLGDSSVGKTSIINQYITNSCHPDHQTTIGIDFFSKEIHDIEKPIQLQIWDTAGQEKFHSLIPSYIKPSTVAVLVYDITQRNSFESIQKWRQMVMDVAKPTIIIAGNKIDLDSNRQVSFEEGKKFADDIGASFVETSARTNENIKELFDIVVSIPVPDLIDTPTENHIITVPLDPPTAAYKGQSCNC